MCFKFNCFLNSEFPIFSSTLIVLQVLLISSLTMTLVLIIINTHTRDSNNYARFIYIYIYILYNYDRTKNKAYICGRYGFYKATNGLPDGCLTMTTTTATASSLTTTTTTRDACIFAIFRHVLLYDDVGFVCIQKIYILFVKHALKVWNKLFRKNTPKNPITTTTNCHWCVSLSRKKSCGSRQDRARDVHNVAR